MSIEYNARKKSTPVAYILLFFFGALGVHRLYAGNIKSGIAMPLLFLISVLFVMQTLWPMFVFGLWWLLDFILVPSMVQDFNTKLARELSNTDSAASAQPVQYSPNLFPDTPTYLQSEAPQPPGTRRLPPPQTQEND